MAHRMKLNAAKNLDGCTLVAIEGATRHPSIVLEPLEYKGVLGRETPPEFLSRKSSSSLVSAEDIC